MIFVIVLCPFVSYKYIIPQNPGFVNTFFEKNKKIFFVKPLDKCSRIWYNIYGKRERELPKRKELNTMEKVIRICEITGKVTTIATNLTHEEAINLVRELAKDDRFGQYRRVV